MQRVVGRVSVGVQLGLYLPEYLTVPMPEWLEALGHWARCGTYAFPQIADWC